MSIKLIAIDLDGTLLTTQKTISRQTMDVIHDVRRKEGIIIVLTTARPPRTTMPFYETLKLTGPMINYNGALVWEPPTSRIITHQAIPVNIARGIVKWARERFPKIRISAEIHDKWYTDFFDDTYLTETAKLHKPNLIAPIETWLTEPITKLLLLGDNEWLSAVNKAIAEDLPTEVTTIQTEGFLLQIMHASVSKLAAVQTITEELGIPREKVMTIGDNVNDTDMIAWAGVGVAMANGHLSSIQVADHIAAHNDEDGVAHAIHEIVISGKKPQGA